MGCRLRRQTLSVSYFQPIRILSVPDDIVIDSALPCARPLSIAHYHAVHIAWYYLMAEPRVLDLRDSFIRRLINFLLRGS